ncbi:MAG TPA: T9SS type A sorting domain-containing protein, partial [Chitinophagaceae bacterium]|nr:T9SS type A sorting domain-containing protein [Chitinophagaceae bacterium]
NVSKGKFQNSVYNVAALDFYSSDNTNSFWIDDVSYSYTPFTTPTLNGAISILGIDNGIVTQQRTPSITFRNLGNTAITSCNIEVNANGNITSQSLTGLNVAPGAAYSFTYANPVTLITGVNTFTATIKNVNGATTDDYPLDDQKTINFTPVVPGADKLVIGEEATGTWCQWCPRGAVGLRNMDKKYHGFFQGIAVHNNDPMEVPVYDSALGTILSGYPSGSVDRGADVDPGSFEGDFLQRIVLTPLAKIKNGASYNSSTGQLDVSLTTEFKSAATGNYRILCVIIEDSVKGSGSGYNQSNAYANNSNGPMGGFESLPNPVPAAQMVYDHVARAIAPGFGGIQNAYPSSVVAGSSYVHNMSFNISAWNKSKIAIVGILLAPDGRIENASSTTIDEAAANGYVVKTNDIIYASSDMNLYPNPTQGNCELLIQTTKTENAIVRLLDINGRLIVSKEVQLYNGANRLPIATNTLPKGMYVVEVTKSGTTSTLKLIKE